MIPGVCCVKKMQIGTKKLVTILELKMHNDIILVMKIKKMFHSAKKSWRNKDAAKKTIR